MSAQEILAAFEDNRQIAPLSATAPLSLAQGYAINAEISALREARGERKIGRKIGFTNRKIWPIYNVDRPVWGWMWQEAVQDIPPDGRIALPPLPQLRLEPEIIFGLRASPLPDMTPAQLLDCIDWLAHGAELVTSIYPDWRFTAADSAAAQAMHAGLWIGPRLSAREVRAAQLESFALRLTGPQTDLQGQARDVLDGPLYALSHLLRHNSDMPGAPPVGAKEIVTTGTLTDAVLIQPGQRWQSALTGLDLPGLDLTFH